MSHRVPFPGKPRGRLKQGRQIVRTAGQPGKPDKLESIEKTRLFLEDFYETYGNSDEDVSFMFLVFVVLPFIEFRLQMIFLI